MNGFLQRILQEIMKKKILGRSDSWPMRRSSHQPSDPVYYIEDCRIFIQMFLVYNSGSHYVVAAIRKWQDIIKALIRYYSTYNIVIWHSLGSSYAILTYFWQAAIECFDHWYLFNCQHYENGLTLLSAEDDVLAMVSSSRSQTEEAIIA